MTSKGVDEGERASTRCPLPFQTVCCRSSRCGTLQRDPPLTNAGCIEQTVDQCRTESGGHVSSFSFVPKLGSEPNHLHADQNSDKLTLFQPKRNFLGRQLVPAPAVWCSLSDQSARVRLRNAVARASGAASAEGINACQHSCSGDRYTCAAGAAAIRTQKAIQRRDL
jgi:hypothetical protein